MGCGISSDNALQLKNMEILRTEIKKTWNLITNDLPEPIKCKVYEAIKRDEIFIIKKITEKYPFKPTEDITLQQNGTTCLHLAAQYNSYHIINYFVKWLFLNQPENCRKIINLQDINGNTPAMLCCINGCDEALYMLLETEKASFALRNMRGKDLMNLAISGKYSNIFKIIKGSQIPRENTYSLENDKDDYEVIDIDEAPIKNVDSEVNKFKEAILSLKAKIDNIKNKEVISSVNDIPSKNVYSSSLRIFKILHNCLKTKVHFSDHEFPLTVKSICNETTNINYELFQKAIWKRSNDLFKDQDITLLQNINSTCIVKGILGVSDFSFCLSLLAEYPSKLYSIFNNHQFNQYGAYSVNLYKDGVLTEIVVDDFFPCCNDKGLSLFSSTIGAEIWVLLLEKAWAKNYGDYCVIEYGDLEDTLECLLGAPSQFIPLMKQNKEKLWKDLIENDMRKYLISACTNVEINKIVGLKANLSYIIIGVYEFKGQKIIKLKDPSLKSKWEGDYSESSSLWNDALKNIVNYSKSEEGIFIMKLDDFAKYFSSITVCYVKNDWNYHFITITSHQRYAEYFEFIIK